MYRGSRLRLLGLYTVLIASAIQGLTPDARSIVSRWGLEWLRRSATAAGFDARRDGMPGNDRPSPPNDSDDETSAELELPGEPGAPTVLRRRVADSHGHPFDLIGHRKPPDALGAHLPERGQRLNGSVVDLTTSLCRLAC
jgi:hypothetical protein